MSVSFVQHRIQAEARARKLARERSGSTEVDIAEVYKFFPFKLFGLTRDDLGRLADTELNAEIELCRVNPEMIRQYLDTKRAGYRVGFISDTYWNSGQLARLLRACAPEISWDFLYASCDHGSSKSEALFERYIAEQDVDAASSIHIGDNDAADVRGARRYGLRARYYPQASAALASKLQRETSVFELLCPHRPSRLDHGARTLRRMVAAQSAEKSAAFQLGLTVLGPVMTDFDAFIEARRTELVRDGGRVAVGFLGRDGFLPHLIWQDAHAGTGSYIEINRRISLVGSADTLEPLCELLGRVVRIDAATFVEIVKVAPPDVMAFFANYPDGIAPGSDLADALPDLMDPREMTEISAGIRARLLAYLRANIPGFDHCTDLILADLGYSASVQKALRRIFDREGLRIRLHGTYLLSLDDAFDDIADADSAAGLISDLVVTPHVKRMLIRNIALLEQICCSAEGSARDYRNGAVLREGDQRPAAQTALVSEIQAGALAFATRSRELAPHYRLHPYRDRDVAALWTAAVLGRLLLLPDDDEVALLGGFQHDVNLGTQALAPLIDRDYVENQINARGLIAACSAPAPPMWLAGSLTTLSPAHAHWYLLFGANHLPANVFGETPCGTLQICLFGRDGRAALETINVYRTGLGDLRLRIPLARRMAIATIALPLAKLTREGTLHGVVVQSGETAADAAKSSEIRAIADDRLVHAGMARIGRHFRAHDDDGCLLVTVEPTADEVAIYTVALSASIG
ncbi:hypothetical protein [Bradyrhizobium jicamae]|uniref:hypothetical protein n=1 Tax=Bradyrhizobium jicamae TaxID=280332 RepID=UPI0020134669|nr:hypothetical protein [Bradyrhizobium jicamae]